MAKKILVVDDEQNIIKVLQARLEAEGYEVVTASDGEEALQKVGTEKPNLIILDIMMPKIDGFEVCRRLKRDETFQHIPVVMLTALGQAANIKEGMEKGADAYIAKPFNTVALLGIIQGLVGR